MTSSNMGTLFAVCGPSGAGKDTLLECARRKLVSDPDYVFPKRFITRPKDAGGEDHIAVSDDEFDALRRNGLFALEWSAHHLKYGIHRAAVDDLAAGRNVVINVSRGILDHARSVFDPFRVVHVTARAETLAARLSARDRETIEDQIARLRRDAAKVSGDDVIQVDNDGSLDTSIPAFLAALRT